MPIFQNDRDLRELDGEPEPGPSHRPEIRLRVDDRDPKIPDGGATTTAVVGDDGEESDGELVETVQQVRSDLPICIKCPRRSVPFLREHTFLQRSSAPMTCPNCLCGIKTVVERHNSSTTHLYALLLIPVCLCFLPYVSKVLRDSVHRCPACGIRLGSKFASASEAFVVCVSHPEHFEDSSRHPDDVEFL